MMSIQTKDKEQVTQELGEQVKKLIEDLYESCYIGQIKVNILPKGYQVFIGMPTVERPFSLAADLSWNKFLLYLKDNLKHSPLQEWFRYTLQLEQPNHGEK